MVLSKCLLAMSMPLVVKPLALQPPIHSQGRRHAEPAVLLGALVAVEVVGDGVDRGGARVGNQGFEYMPVTARLEKVLCGHGDVSLSVRWWGARVPAGQASIFWMALIFAAGWPQRCGLQTGWGAANGRDGVGCCTARLSVSAVKLPSSPLAAQKSTMRTPLEMKRTTRPTKLLLVAVRTKVSSSDAYTGLPTSVMATLVTASWTRPSCLTSTYTAPAAPALLSALATAKPRNGSPATNGRA